VQAYLEEEGRDGLLPALDWEKAFDRVSWEYYHLALEALQFGPVFRGWARLLSNPDALPIRRIKAIGGRSNPFSIHCGVPQGCPLSPLAFLVVAEALTRLIQRDATIKGIEITEPTLKLFSLLTTLKSLPRHPRISPKPSDGWQYTKELQEARSTLI
jgi:hypothetical protein